MQQCAHLRYVVEPLPGVNAEAWTVAFDGQHVGRFRRRREALEAALSDARRVGGLGHATEVWARRRDGTVGAAFGYDWMQHRMEKRNVGSFEAAKVFSVSKRP
jgi:hypothetical protein